MFKSEEKSMYIWRLRTEICENEIVQNCAPQPLIQTEAGYTLPILNIKGKKAHLTLHTPKEISS